MRPPFFAFRVSSSRRRNHGHQSPFSRSAYPRSRQEDPNQLGHVDRNSSVLYPDLQEILYAKGLIMTVFPRVAIADGLLHADRLAAVITSHGYNITSPSEPADVFVLDASSSLTDAIVSAVRDGAGLVVLAGDAGRGDLGSGALSNLLAAAGIEFEPASGAGASAVAAAGTTAVPDETTEVTDLDLLARVHPERLQASGSLRTRVPSRCPAPLGRRERPAGRRRRGRHEHRCRPDRRTGHRRHAGRGRVVLQCGDLRGRPPAAPPRGRALHHSLRFRLAAAEVSGD